MRPVILTDLDDTLFQTIRKCPEGEGDLKQMSTLADGSPSGFATVAQQNFLSWLRCGQIVPVTARSSKVLARVEIDQAPAIVSNGGCILLEDGGHDEVWHSRLLAEANTDADVEEVYEVMTRNLDPERFRHWVVSERDLPLYIVIKSQTESDSSLQKLLWSLSSDKPESWRHHLNGNNLAFMPPWLSKRNAVAHLIDQARAANPGSPIIGIGDSLSDVGFMDLCDFAIAPTSSQLWNSIAHNSEWVR